MLNMQLLLTTLFLVIFTTFANQYQTTPLDSFLPFLRVFRSFLNNVLQKQIETSKHLSRLDKIGRLQKLPKNIKFPCDSRIAKFRSDKVPESAHKIRPGDIDVVGAMGDSLTVGSAATALNYLEIAYENRGRAFSIGGEEDWRTYFTLPNILKTFNPNLIGYSLNAISTDRKSRFNVAEAGAVSRDGPYMAKVLVKRIKLDKGVDLRKDWKMITIMIGNNDFCSQICYEKDLNFLLQRHRLEILEVLRIFRDNLPRTMVNIILTPSILAVSSIKAGFPRLYFEANFLNHKTFRFLLEVLPHGPKVSTLIDLNELSQLPNTPLPCFLPHLLFCPCLFASRFASKLQSYFDFMAQWQQMELETANMQEFDKDDFTVIPHIFTLNYTFPKTSEGQPDYTYLAYDCFHFSQKGHSRFANDLWNSIMTPFGMKDTSGHTEFENIICPSKIHPYISTRRNSAKGR